MPNLVVFCAPCKTSQLKLKFIYVYYSVKENIWRKQQIQKLHERMAIMKQPFWKHPFMFATENASLNMLIFWSTVHSVAFHQYRSTSMTACRKKNVSSVLVFITHKILWLKLFVRSHAIFFSLHIPDIECNTKIKGCLEQNCVYACKCTFQDKINGNITKKSGMDISKREQEIRSYLFAIPLPIVSCPGYKPYIQWFT